MLKKPMFYIVIVLLTTFLAIEYAISSTNKYSYDFNEPVSIVQAACKMIMNSDYTDMILITEQTEKKRTMDALTDIQGNPELMKKLKKEAEKLISFQILDSEVFTNENTNFIAVVYTKWKSKLVQTVPSNPSGFVRPSEANDPDAARRRRTDTDIYVDYLLKKFNDQWKIVSRRTR